MTHSVLWWSARHVAVRIDCESLQEATALAQHIRARGPYRARVETAK